MKLKQKFAAVAAGAALLVAGAAASAAQPGSDHAISGVAAAPSEMTAQVHHGNRGNHGNHGHFQRPQPRRIAPHRGHHPVSHRVIRHYDHGRNHHHHDNRRIIVPIPLPVPFPVAPYHGQSIQQQFRQCFNYTANSPEADRAANRVIGNYPYIAPFAHSRWNSFERQVADQMCREELNLPRGDISVGPYSVHIPGYVLRR